MISPQERSDKLIRSTDLDALSCRYSASIKGYFDDPYTPVLIESFKRYLQYAQGYTSFSASRSLKNVFREPKFPLINRGTYLRTVSIDQICRKFIEEYPTCHILSIGSGSDTRAFKMLQDFPSISYTEIDFEETTKFKKLAILGNPNLSNIVGTSETAPEIKDKQQFTNFDYNLYTERYSLIGFDLRNDLSQLKLQKIPTLVISECVLCYLSPEDNNRIINTLKEMIPQVSFVIYEPMSLNDLFGTTMSLNLSGRGIRMPTFDWLPDLKSRKKFGEDLGFNVLQLTDLSDIGGYGNKENCWIDDKELSRINSLELIDEIEEIRLLLKHYCLVYYGEKRLNLNWSIESLPQV